jgi:hypothetical protein
VCYLYVLSERFISTVILQLMVLNRKLFNEVKQKLFSGIILQHKIILFKKKTFSFSFLKMCIIFYVSKYYCCHFHFQFLAWIRFHSQFWQWNFYAKTCECAQLCNESLLNKITVKVQLISLCKVYENKLG